MDWVSLVFLTVMTLSFLSLLFFVIFEIKKNKMTARKKPRREDVIERWRKITHIRKIKQIKKG